MHFANKWTHPRIVMKWEICENSGLFWGHKNWNGEKHSWTHVYSSNICQRIEWWKNATRLYDSSKACRDWKKCLWQTSFLLLLEKACYINLPSTTMMMYWPQFWRVVCCILQGKAIRLFSGPKGLSSYLSGESRGHCQPQHATVNFAVPDM